MAVSPALVSVMLAKNETVVLFPMAEIGRLVHENSDAFFMSTASRLAPVVRRPRPIMALPSTSRPR